MLAGPFIITNIAPVLGISIFVTSIWTMDDTKTTLRCHSMFAGPFIVTNTTVVLGRSIVLTSIWRMGDMKATLRCHVHASGLFMAVSTQPLALPWTYFASSRQGPGPKNGDHSTLNDVHWGSKSNGGARGARTILLPPPTGIVFSLKTLSYRLSFEVKSLLCFIVIPLTWISA